MADDGRTTLGKLSRGDVFRAADGLLWRKEMTRPSDGHCYCHPVSMNGGPTIVAGDAEVEPLNLPALLKELDELRALTHDLLIDRDAAYGREVGRGEALAALRGVRAEGRAANWGAEGLAPVDAAIYRLNALGPVRPLPPPERLAARCRALGDALRACVIAWNDPNAPASPQGAIDAARKLLEERGSGP
jgi:hypothetical protein